ncbi:MAG: hypothetical protein WAU81_15035 [Candidatus Aminicenantales bacterium]
MNTGSGQKYKFDPEDKETVWVWDIAENEKMLSAVMLGSTHSWASSAPSP